MTLHVQKIKRCDTDCILVIKNVLLKIKKQEQKKEKPNEQKTKYSASKVNI